MKQLEEIFKQEPIYLHNWEESKKTGVISDFEYINISKAEFEAADCPIGSKEYWLNEKSKMQQKLKEWEGINILFASYGEDNYSGDAFVLFEKNGKLYEVNGSHCSCYGLEGQFDPEETTLEAIRYRLLEGTMGRDAYSDNEFADELMQFLGV